MKGCIPESAPHRGDSGDGREQVQRTPSEFIPCSAAPSAFPMSPLRAPAKVRKADSSPDAALAALWCWLLSEKAEQALTRFTEQSGKNERNAALIPHFPSSPGSPRTLSRNARLCAEPPPRSQHTGPLRIKSRLASSLNTS